MYYEIVKKNKSLIYRQKERNRNMKLIICKQLKCDFFSFSSRPKGKNEFDNNANESFNINT